VLEVYSKANCYESFSNLTNPYVKQEEVGNTNFNHYIVFANGGGTIPSNLDNYFKPLDIVKIREIHKICGITYYHFGVYLGDVGNGKRICHFTRENNGVRLTDWDGFLKDRIGELYRYHPTIPFKCLMRMADQIAWAEKARFWEDAYSLHDRNCEHFANMIAYGINYSEQVERNKTALTAPIDVMRGFIAPFTLGLSLIGGPCTVNNGKGSTIKLVNEMSESNDKLGEEDT
jgi:hypothetical protein